MPTKKKVKTKKRAAKKKKKTTRRTRPAAADLESLDQLNEAPYNPRTIDPKAAAGLAASLRKFGDLSGIVWNRRSGNLICGHQRWKQLRTEYGKELTFDKERQVVVAPDGSEWPVRVVDWHLTKEKAANVAANNTFIQGDFDDERLAVLLMEVEEADGDLFAGVMLSELVAKKKGKDKPADTSPQLSGLEFRVIVTCQSEEDQAALIRRLESESYACKVMMS